MRDAKFNFIPFIQVETLLKKKSEDAKTVSINTKHGILSFSKPYVQAEGLANNCDMQIPSIWRQYNPGLYFDQFVQYQDDLMHLGKEAYELKPIAWTPPKRTVNPFRSLWDSLLSNI